VSTLHSIPIYAKKCQSYTISRLYPTLSTLKSVNLTQCPSYTVSRLYPTVSTLHSVQLTQNLVSIQQCPSYIVSRLYTTVSILHSISSLYNSAHLTQCPPYTEPHYTLFLRNVITVHQYLQIAIINPNSPDFPKTFTSEYKHFVHTPRYTGTIPAVLSWRHGAPQT
jgi:hypothetical protein